MSVEFNDENQGGGIGQMRMGGPMGQPHSSSGPLVKLLFKWKLAKDEGGASKILIGVLVVVIALTAWMLHIAGVFGSPGASAPIVNFPANSGDAPPAP